MPECDFSEGTSVRSPFDMAAAAVHRRQLAAACRASPHQARRVDERLLDELLPMPDPTAPPRVADISTLRGLGFTKSMVDHRIRTGRWRRILPRTYLTVDTLTWHDRLSAALAFAGPDALISGSAALVDDTRTVAKPQLVLVLVPGHHGTRSTGWVRVRRVAPMPERRLAMRPRRAPVARAVADHALGQRRLDDVRAVVADVVRRDLCDVRELERELARAGRRGSALLRQAVAEVSLGAWSAPEASVAALLRRHRVRGFAQNVRIDLPGGWFVVDFLWRELNAVLEIDSVAHHFSPPDLDATMRRHLQLETLGFSVIHRSPASIRAAPDQFVDDVRAWLAARRTSLRP
jgi:very-short-patch-repair endonuclease